MSSEIEVVVETPAVPLSSGTRHHNQADEGDGEEELQELLERFSDRLGVVDVESSEPGLPNRRRRNMDKKGKQEDVGFFLDDIPAHKRLPGGRNPKKHARMKFIVRMLFVAAAMVLLVNLARHFIHLQQPESHAGGVHLLKHIVTERGGGYLGRKATLKGHVVDPIDKEERQVEVQLVDEEGEVSKEMEVEVTDGSEKEADLETKVLEEVKNIDAKKGVDEEVVEEEMAVDGGGMADGGAGGVGDADVEGAVKDGKDW